MPHLAGHPARPTRLLRRGRIALPWARQTCTWVACLLAGSVLGCGSGSQPTQATPDGAVALVLGELSAGRPVVLWNSLPGSRQAEVRKLLSEAVDDVDPQLWEAAMALAGKAARTAREKRDFALASRALAQAPLRPTPDEAQKAWGHLTTALEALASSDLKTAAGLKALDPPAFLAGPGAEILRQFEQAAPILGASDPFRKMRLAKIALVDENEDDETALVRIEYPGQAPFTVELAWVEDRWAPYDLGDDHWDATRQALAARLEAFVAWQRRDKDRLLALVRQIDQALDRLDAAKTQAEFDEAWDQTLKMRFPDR